MAGLFERHCFSCFVCTGYFFIVPEYYAEEYLDVKAALGEEAAVLYEHYQKYGRAEGRKATADGAAQEIGAGKFDPDFYANTYPDVKAAFGTDVAALYNHYVNYGKAEGRAGYAGQTAGGQVSAPAEKTVVSTKTDIDGMKNYILTVYLDGSRINHITGIHFTNEVNKDVILRTDYGDGLQDKDGNGIDDRDPYNGSGMVDLNYKEL